MKPRESVRKEQAKLHIVTRFFFLKKNPYHDLMCGCSEEDREKDALFLSEISKNGA